ncbi:hypothetical protein [Streptomyces aureocirculatus]|nr:hypothetical protein [Streptomyces aureocirculatus]
MPTVCGWGERFLKGMACDGFLLYDGKLTAGFQAVRTGWSPADADSV